MTYTDEERFQGMHLLKGMLVRNRVASGRGVPHAIQKVISWDPNTGDCWVERFNTNGMKARVKSKNLDPVEEINIQTKSKQTRV